MLVLCVFFFKQKTAYEMRISDWSSDVCSSDLADARGEPRGAGAGNRPGRTHRRESRPIERLADIYVAQAGDQTLIEQRRFQRRRLAGEERRQRSEERRVGKACVCT